jgi:hypothetical protein
MFPRILRSLIALATIIVVYQAYVLLAVPWLEPPLAARQAPPSTADDHDKAALADSKYQRLLSNYFSGDHWSQTAPFKVLGNWPVLLVADDYERQDGGWIKIFKFALLIFPTPVEEGMPPPRDAIILEAPGGARLQFDDNFRPDRFQIGQIVQGRFPGRITIRSEMHEPGPDDDLFMETSDLEMNSKLLYTQNPMGPVRFRLGPNVGSGSGLEIRFRDEKGAAARKMGVNSLEIRRDVQLRVDLKTDSFLPGSEGSGSHALRGNPAPGRSGGPDSTQSVDGARSHAERGNEVVEARPPVDVTCTGPFQFDFVRYVASFDQNVQVRQLDPSGPGDRLDAQQLDIHFAPKAPPAGAAAAPGDDRRLPADLRQLEPTLVVAQGSPVVVASPRRQAETRSQRIQLDLRQRRVVLDGGRDTTLTQGKNVLKAPTIEYWHPASDAGTSVGRFRANGPGSLYYVLDPDKPNEVFQAAWQKSVELGRSQGQPTLTLDGRPQLGVAGMGSLAADQLTIWFRELVDAAPTASGLALKSPNPASKQSELIPDRLSATGQVEIASPRLSARVEQLLATFEVIVEPPAAAIAAAPSEGGQPAGISAQLNPAARNSPTTAYHVEADRLQLGARLRGRDAAPATLECDGNVVLREIALVPNNQQPLELRGGRLTASGLDAGAARATIFGAGGARPRPVQIAGRGMTFRTAVVEIDQRENRIWSDGPGQATILITRDLAGRAAAAPTPFDIQWQNGMDFDGRLATFRGNILGQGADAALRCDQLVAKLAAPIKFDAASASSEQNAADVAEIEFQGQVMISHRTRDESGPTSHERLELARFSINQQTGVISGAGPGIIRSTRFGDTLGGVAGLSAGSPGSTVPPRAAASKLNFLRVDFDGRLGGDLYTREIAFNRRVRTVYGPVDAWEQELDVNRPENLPPGSFTLNCDELSANEDPVAARAVAASERSAGQLAPMQLTAKGNVQINGQSATQGRFFASALTATYDQSKQTLALNGDGRTDAWVEMHDRPGEPFRAQLIEYSWATGAPTARVGGFKDWIFTFPQASPATPGPTTGQSPAAGQRR